MKYVRMGNSGLKLTEVTFGAALTIGTENNDPHYAKELIDQAWIEGIRSFDVSNNYGNSESLVSNALKAYPREEFVIATKGSWPIGDTPYHRGLSRKHIMWAIDESLKKVDSLGYIDIYYAHRYDPEVPMEEIVKTFNNLINNGKIRYWATSEWPIHALIDCYRTCERLNMEKPILEQFIYSFAVRKIEFNGMLDLCRKENIGTLGFSPLCQGFLTGKYRNGIPEDSRISKKDIIKYDKTKNFYEQNKNRIDAFLDICDKYGIQSSHIALLWCIRNKIYPIIGASKPQQIENNMKALKIDVPNELWNELSRIEPQ